MKTRLKLYDDKLKISITKKDKNKLRKLAFKNKKTMSEFTRTLIKFFILLDEENNRNKNTKTTNYEINKILEDIWRDNYL